MKASMRPSRLNISPLAWLSLFGLSLLSATAGSQVPATVTPTEAGGWRATTTVMGDVRAMAWMAGEMAPPAQLNWEPRLGYAFVVMEWVDGSPARWPQVIALELVTDQGPSTQWIELNPSLKVIGPISSGQTAWSVASQYRSQSPDPSVDMATLINQIVAINPHAFSGQEASTLLEGAFLRLEPSPAWVAPEDRGSVAVEARERMDISDSSSSASDRVSPGEVDPEPIAVVTPMLPRQTIGLGVERSVLASWSDLINDSRLLGRAALAVFSVVILMMVWHGGARWWADRARRRWDWPRLDTDTAVATQLQLAELHLGWGQPSEAYHFLLALGDEMTPRQRREAQRLMRTIEQAKGGLNG